MFLCRFVFGEFRDQSGEQFAVGQSLREGSIWVRLAATSSSGRSHRGRRGKMARAPARRLLPAGWMFVEDTSSFRFVGRKLT